MGADCEDAPSEVASVAEQVAEERSGSPRVYERFAEDGAGEDLRRAWGSEATTGRRIDAKRHSGRRHEPSRDAWRVLGQGQAPATFACGTTVARSSA